VSAVPEPTPVKYRPCGNRRSHAEHAYDYVDPRDQSPVKWEPDVPVETVRELVYRRVVCRGSKW
jgi:hypothetical protein